MPDPRSNTPSLLFARFVQREAQGEEPDFDAYCEAHPEHAAALQQLKVNYGELRTALAKVLPPVPVSERIRERFGGDVDPGIRLGEQEPQVADHASTLLGRLADRSGAYGRYRLREEIARGGQGAVIRVWDEDLGRNLAMKIMLDQADGASQGGVPDSRALGRFLEEAQVTGQLDHPGIVPVHELGLDSDGRIYFTMKLVKGDSLARIFEYARSERLGWTQLRVLGALLKVCEAMSYAHNKRVIHRDLKPANIMVGRFGEVYVMDWGLARVLDREDGRDVRIRPLEDSAVLHTERRAAPTPGTDSPLITMDGDVVGTPAYMSPEQARGDLDAMGPQSDVYALGAMLYHLIAGHMPHARRGAVLDNHEVWRLVQAGPPAALGELSPETPVELVAICEKAMARDHEQRYQDMIHLAEDLRAFLEHRVVTAYERGSVAQLRKWVSRNRPLAAAVAATILALVGGLVSALVFMARADASSREAERRRVGEQQALATSRLNETEARDHAQAAERLAYSASLLGATMAHQAGHLAEAQRLHARCPEQHRGWEWGQLGLRLDQAQHVLVGHTARITVIDVSPDGARVVSGSDDSTVRVWDTRSGECLALLDGHQSPLRTVEFSPDGSRVLSSEEYGLLLVWDLGAPDSDPLRLEGHLSGCFAARFTPDGERVVSASRDGTMRVWSALTGVQDLSLDAHHGVVRSVAVSADGRRVVSGAADGSVRLWDAASGFTSRELGQHAAFVVDAAFTRDGSRVVSASSDDTLRIWDVESGELLHELARHRGDVVSIAVDSTSDRVASASLDGTLRISDVVTGAELFVLEADGAPITKVRFSPDGELVVAGSESGVVAVWNSRTGELGSILRGHVDSVLDLDIGPQRILASGAGDGTLRLWAGEPVLAQVVLELAPSKVRAFSLSPDGRGVLVASSDGRVRSWSAASGRALHALQLPVRPMAGSFGPDAGTFVATSVRPATEQIQAPGVALWDSATGEAVSLEAPGHTDGPVVLAFSPDARWVATASIALRPKDNDVLIWDAHTGRQVRALGGHQERVSRLLFSPDSQRVTALSERGVLRMWELESGESRGHFDGLAWPADVSFGPHGRRLLCASPNALRVWEVATGNALLRRTLTPSGGPDGQHSARSLARFGPAGSLLVTSDGRDGGMRLWSTESGSSMGVLQGHRGGVTAVAFSPDGARIASGAEDGGVRVWDPVTGESLQVLEGHEAPVEDLTFSADGARIVSSSNDRVIVWNSARQ